MHPDAVLMDLQMPGIDGVHVTRRILESNAAGAVPLPLGITAYRLAQATGLSQTRLSEIIRGRRRITTDTALRLSRAFGLSERFWLNLQNDYDIEIEHDEHDAELARVERLTPA